MTLMRWPPRAVSANAPANAQPLAWPAIWAGAVLAVAVHAAFIVLSLALGCACLRLDQPATVHSSILLFLGGFVGTGFISTAMGGWMVGRIAPCRSRQTLALHALSMWAITSILATCLMLFALCTGGAAWGLIPWPIATRPSAGGVLESGGTRIAVGALLAVGMMVGCLVAAVAGVRRGGRP